jgi:alanine dehydrogenase
MGFRLHVVPEDQAWRLVSYPDGLRVLAAAYQALSGGTAEMSPKYHWEFTAGRSAAFASYLAGLDAMAIKIAMIRPGNPGRGLASEYAQILVHDPATGVPVALIDGTSVTAFRTGAAAALGARALARPESSVAGIVGTGVVAASSVKALASCFKLERVLVAGRPGSPSAARMIDSLRGEFAFDIVPATHEAAVREADIVVTATPVTEPIVADAWVRPGTHISAVGADWQGKQELELATMKRARFITDNRTQALTIGAANVPHAQGLFSEPDIAGELGEVLLDRIPGRESGDQVTVFDSSGVAVQDCVIAKLIYDQAVSEGTGQTVEI